ncbi:MAG: lipoprotein-releasing system permease protein [Acidobacteriota bacterium]|jgi:lipoprotein-releasing system permease protein|nr:lipoprotein-releasing system permease protein [Acidobacteriota bacterium]
MPYELFLALRYLRARRPRRLARVTALAAILGIAFGVAALIVALALSNGFRDEMRDKILRGTAHITLMRRDTVVMTDWRAILKRIRETAGVADAAPTTYDGALLSSTNGSSYAVLRGLDRDSTRAIEEVRRTLIAGAIEPLLNEPSQFETDNSSSVQQPEDGRGAGGPEELPITPFDKIPSQAAMPNAILGTELAARTNLHVGDTATIISGEATLTPLGLAPRYRRVRVAGIFKSGLYEYDATWVYLSLDTAASFSGAPAPAASIISIEVTDIYAVEQTAARLREQLGSAYTTVTWQEANRPLFAALALERRMGLFIIALIILIATLNITTTLVLLVVERRSDIAILSAMGARARSIMFVFIIEGALIGIIGAGLGLALGLAACFVGDYYKLVSLPADIYSISNVPFHAHALDVALAALVALGLSLLATIYPARAAARLRPAEALRDS